ncbi:MAG TPA: type II toxin-antitoxin system RelB/DinJ family antitoxin [Acidimicrobiia bacterium]
MTTQAKADDVVRARINRQVKQEATTILASIGLTPSDAYRMLLMRVVHEGALPFEPLVPGETTLAAMEESKTKQLPQFESIGDLMSDLNASD